MISIFGYYEYFYEVAQSGSMSAAASRLHITQPALSRSISNLEAELKCSLFKRNTKGVTLTHQGMILFETVKQSRSLLDEARVRIEGTIERETFLAATIGSGNDLATFVLLPWLKSFKREFSNIAITIHDARSMEIIQAISDETVDLGLLHIRVENSSLEFYNMFDMDYCLIGGSDYRHTTAAGELALSQLSRYPIITLLCNSVKRQNIDSFLNRHGIFIEPAYEVSNSALLMQMVEANMGLAIIPRLFAKNKLDSGSLIEIKTDIPLPSDTAWMVWKKNRPMSAAVTSLMNHLRTVSAMMRKN